MQYFKDEDIFHVVISDEKETNSYSRFYIRIIPHVFIDKSCLLS
jgi:hypothetical protein